MDTHPYAYHKNIHIQHSVCDDVHLEDPVKKQSLNIRIYSDRKNNYF